MVDVNEGGRLSTVIECFLPIPRFTKNYVGRRRTNNDNDTGGKVIKKRKSTGRGISHELAALATQRKFYLFMLLV